MTRADLTHELSLLRLAAQRLIGPRCATAAEAVDWLTAVQAQDHRGALTSVALRTRAGSRSAVDEALDAGSVVKSWPMRGTLHLVSAPDLPWLLRLLAPRAVAASDGRRVGLGLVPAQLEQARELAVGALTGGRRLSRAELFAVWEGAGLPVDQQRGVHLLRFVAMTGTVVFGPTRADGEHLLVLVEEWIPAPRAPERDEAFGEVALRYYRSHGPATLADLARWAHLRAADARTGTALARPHLARLEVAGTEHLMDPQTPDRLAAAREEAAGVLLLPGFDEFVLGYGDRSAQLAPEHADRIVPGGNGMFRPTVVAAGQVVGTWTRAGRGPRPAVTATPFTSFPSGVEGAVARLAVVLPQ